MEFKKIRFSLFLFILLLALGLYALFFANKISLSPAMLEDRTAAALSTRWPASFSKVIFENINSDENFTLSQNQAALLKDMFSSDFASVPKSLLDSKPDIVISVYEPSGEDPKQYSIWLDRGFFYPGYFLGAWTEAMTGRNSVCYKLGSKDKDLLKEMKKYLSMK